MSEDAGDRLLTRRDLLRGGAALGSVVALAGCEAFDDSEPTATAEGSVPTETAAETPTVTTTPTQRFENVVDVTEAGADPNGETPIGPVLEEVQGDDTLLVFPDGRYTLGEYWFSGLQNFGVTAERGASPVITPSGPIQDLGSYFLSFMNVRNFLMSGLTFDFRREGVGGRVQVISRGDFTVRNVKTVGKYPDQVTAFRFDVRNDEGTALVENLHAKSTRQTNESVTGLYVGRQHAGELTFRNCNVQNFSDNGLYASAPGGAGGEIDGANGPVHVEGGLYKNNNTANVRLGSTGSTARNVRIVVDEVPPHPNDVVNARGLRLRARKDQIIENCEILIGPNGGKSFGGIVFHHDSGRAFIHDTSVRVDRDGVNAIRAIYPHRNRQVGPVFENLRITGEASSQFAVTLQGRDDTEFRNCCIQQTGKNRSGIRFVNSNNCLVADTSFDVTGRQLFRKNSRVRTRNLENGGCS